MHIKNDLNKYFDQLWQQLCDKIDFKDVELIINCLVIFYSSITDFVSIINPKLEIGVLH